jgi:trehalose-phosphatase
VAGRSLTPEPLHPVEVLLATDFDGTIAPIAATPGEAVIDPRMARFLECCATVPGVAVAVISGRDVDDVRPRLGGLCAMVAGSHGLECVDAGGAVVWTTDHSGPELPPALLRELLRSDLRIERKKYSFAMHFRGTAAGEREIDRVTSAVTAWADEHNLDVIAGRKVVEIRVRGGGKRAALRAMAARLRARHFLYAGDDVTDFPALAFAASNGRAIFVESEERTPPAIAGLWRVRGVDDLCAAFAHELLQHVPAVALALAPHFATDSVSSASESSRDRSTTR